MENNEIRKFQKQLRTEGRGGGPSNVVTKKEAANSSWQLSEAERSRRQLPVPLLMLLIVWLLFFPFCASTMQSYISKCPTVARCNITWRDFCPKCIPSQNLKVLRSMMLIPKGYTFKIKFCIGSMFAFFKIIQSNKGAVGKLKQFCC